MKQYRRKLKLTLIITLGVFALLINLITFSLISASVERNYMELSRVHMEHQYQNCRQRMEVLGQQFLSLAEDPQFVAGVENGNLELVKKKLQSFYQSASGTLSLAVYTFQDGQASYLAGEGRSDQISQNQEDAMEIGASNWEEAFWYVPEGESRTMNYLCQLKSEAEPFGCLLVKYEIASLMEELAGQENYDSWEAHLAVAAGRPVWTDDEAYWEEVEGSFWQDTYDYVTEGKLLRSSRELTENGVRLVQVMIQRTDSLYLATAGGLAVLFLVSLGGICLVVNRLTDSLMEPLERLKRRMEEMRVGF